MIYKFQSRLCNESYYIESIRHLPVRSEHIGISPLTDKKVQPRKNSVVCHYFLNHNYSPNFEDFSVLCHEKKKHLLELKEILLIMKDRPSINQNIHSSPLDLFE